MTKSIILSFVLLVTLKISAQPGSLDGDFDADGKVITSIDNSNDQAYAVVVQPDGKILVAGNSDNGNDEDFAVVRYHIDGSLDNSFSVDGKVTTDLQGEEDFGYDIQLQADGKIVVGGASKFGSYSDFGIVRYNSNGTLDNSFGGNGIVVTDFSGESDNCRALAIQPDGKIIAGGYAYDQGVPLFAVARYNTDGSLDNTFSVDGKVTTSINGIQDVGHGVAVQSDGKIILAGYTNTGTYYGFALVRYNTDGTLDQSFGSSGIVTATYSSNFDLCYDVVIQQDGKILAGGYADGASNYDFCVMRFNTNGTLDNTFSVDGKVVIDLSGYPDYGHTLVLQPDGKVLFGGRSANNVNYDFSFMRLNTDGTLDNSFGTNGKVFTDFGDQDRCYGIDIQPNGRIVLAGYARANNKYNFAAARYLSGLNIGILQFSAGIHEALIYPNPIGHEAVLEYTLPENENLSIELYDITGRLIQTFLSNEERPFGANSEVLTFGEYLPAGPYFLKMYNNTGSLSIKMVK